MVWNLGFLAGFSSSSLQAELELELELDLVEQSIVVEDTWGQFQLYFQKKHLLHQMLKSN